MTISSLQRNPRQPLVAVGQIDHHVADLTVAASGEATLQQLQDKLAEAGQWLPIDGDPALPLRVLVETNSTGPLRLGFGAWRDLLLGMQFKTPSGKLITAGGRTMKNVAGYDLTKFMVGQFGLFGQIVTITTRTYKRPDGALLAHLPYSLDTARNLMVTPCRPHWAMLSDGKLFCGFYGDENTLLFYESALPKYQATEIKRQTVEQDIVFRNERWLGKRLPIVFRACVPPTRALEFLGSVEDSTCSVDPIFGIIVGSCDTGSKTEQMNQIAAKLGGKVIYNEPERIGGFFGATGAELQLLQRLQAAFNQ